MNMNNLIKQAQKMQTEMGKLQEELKTREYEASSGGGVVSARVNGQNELLGLAIKPEVVDPEDIEMLSDLVIAAVNEALKAAADATSAEMGKLTGGMGMPGMF